VLAEGDALYIEINGNEVDAFKGVGESLPRIKNLAIAAPYSRAGTDHFSIIEGTLTRYGYAVSILKPWIFARKAHLMD
jgi:hypothetical protein